MILDRYYVVESLRDGEWVPWETLYDMTLRQARAAFKRDYLLEDADVGAWRLTLYVTTREVVR